MLNEVDFPLTNSQISEFILDEGYTTYFKLQQALSELLESGFIREESTHHRTFYHLTEDGAETIHYFTNDISPAIQHDIDEFLKEKHYELKNEMSVKADYFENSNMEYSVRCQVIEQGLPLIDLTVTCLLYTSFIYSPYTTSSGTKTISCPKIYCNEKRVEIQKPQPNTCNLICPFRISY